MRKHTPGPWYVIGAEVFKDIGDQRWAVAVAHDWSEDTAENARLIAAAPALLEALRFALRDMEATRAQVASHAPNVGVLAASIAQARDAIRKATGE